MPIIRLPDTVVSQIAAGEVVERPASALKELVENALDAGSTHLEIGLAAGGKELIRVSDNGRGIPLEELPVALERHATSKVRRVEDLHSITTFGFRGEALPSIASVSEFLIESRATGAEVGGRIEVSGGVLSPVRPVSRPPGTVVEVRNLFLPVPARRKFLKSETAELRRCFEVIDAVIFSREDVGLRVSHDGHESYNVPSRAALEDRAEVVWGRKLRGQLHSLDWEGTMQGSVPVRVSGLLSGPRQSSPAARSIFLMVNGRPIRDRALAAAVTQAYREVLVEQRYPFAVIRIELDPERVDVNVHPAKTEVRFQDPGAVFSAVHRAVKHLVESAPWNREREKPLPLSPWKRQAGVQDSGQLQPPSLPQMPLSDGFAAFGYARRGSAAPAVVLDAQAEPAEPRESRGRFGSLDVIGQVRNEFLLCQDGEALIVIDQHAAMERVAFERLRRRFDPDAKPAARQPLLVPETVELSRPELAAVVEGRAVLEKLGFEFEPFGPTTVLLRSVPAIFGRRQPSRLFLEIAGDLADEGVRGADREAIDQLCARMACHAVIRGPRPLSPEERQAFLDEMDEAGFGAHCPHGRPVYFEIPFVEIERRFGKKV